MNELYSELSTALDEFMSVAQFSKDSLIVVGCSTSEVSGQHIGSSGSADVAQALYAQLNNWSRQHQLQLAFQSCEHLNRALVLEREAAQRRGYNPVFVIPVAKAGGAMAAHAYRQFADPVVVENIQADGGIDIGQTLIGMHLKPVAVPLRSTILRIGEAPIVLATTRLKRIGGERAVYVQE
ncbi:TIGR01440 family protein [Aureibacillus halotolerans]|uniref:UPF0340 protein EV213_109112 n=1 Tax=Aureibacillus halotolerans TaxID=1508390 RepID=A0A4R6U225_9BACI|nr:TIGR01440 family protein [Aureibacillus halotolerans]TDQ38743.1 uncharacterized protein (TIGR01440 family) [Aureibacillus halotolerans]